MQRLIPPIWRQLFHATRVGWVLSTIGLASGTFGLMRLVSVLNGRSASELQVAATLAVGALGSASGFLLLASGSPSWNDETRESGEDSSTDPAGPRRAT